MRTITRKDALTVALAHIPSTETAVRDVISKMITSLEKSHAPSEEAREKVNEKRRNENAAKREALLNVVSPIIRKAITTTPQTAQQIFDQVSSDLPTDMTIGQVRHMLTYKELGADVIRETNGKNPNTYHF